MTVRQITLLTVVALMGILLASAAAAQQTGSDQSGSGSGSSDSSGSQQPSDNKTPQPVQTQLGEETLSPAETKALQDRLQSLKDQILASRTQLEQLQDDLSLRSALASDSNITHTDQTGGAFEVESVHYILDGKDIYNKKKADGGLDTKLDNLKVFTGNLLPGDHMLSVDLYYKSKGGSLATYLEKRLLNVKSYYNFTVEEGEPVNIGVLVYDKGGSASNPTERLKIKITRKNK